jgi:hypothetical protein
MLAPVLAPNAQTRDEKAAYINPAPNTKIESARPAEKAMSTSRIINVILAFGVLARFPTEVVAGWW